MAYNTKSIVKDLNQKPIPQYYNPDTDSYEVLQGENGAARHIIYGADGNPIATAGNKLAVRASEVETLLNDIKGKDFATQTTLSQILAKIIAAPATEAKQTAIELILNSLDGKDYSTLAKQNEILAKLAALETKLSGTLDTQLSGSNMDLRGTAATKPLATAVTIGATYWSVDTDPSAEAIEVSDGTKWVVI